MQIVEKRLDELQPYENNPRRNDNAVEYVANSIKEFGFKVPIIVDSNDVIVAGHTRYLAAQQLDMETVPTITADDLTPEQIRAFRIADNKVADKSIWDEALLGKELRALSDEFDMTDFGFGEFELTILQDDFGPEPYDDELINEYSGNEEQYTAKKRVIITYNSEDEANVAELLGIPEIKKVTYDYEDLL